MEHGTHKYLNDWNQFMTMDESYIAGFFDGEGSAMILTIKRTLKLGTIFRFRPVIRISQKYRMSLDAVCEHLGFGHVTKTNKDQYAYVVNGLDGVITFVDRIKPYSIIKKEVLSNVREFAAFQKKHTRSAPYSLEETLKMIDIRDRNFEMNLVQRSGLSQKYPKEIVMGETSFISDEKEWDAQRHKNAYIAGWGAYTSGIKKPRDLMVACACGCGGEFPKYDNRGRERRYISGHNNRKHNKVII